jgi:hypothetical protein
MADPLRVLIDQDIHPRELLSETLDRDVAFEVAGELDEDGLIEALDGIDVLVTTSRLSVTRRVLSETDLPMVAKFGTGINNVDLEAAAEVGTTVVYTPGLNALSVAEHAVTLLLAVRRNLRPGRAAIENDEWRDEVPSATPVTGTTCGIIGFGNIGSRIARLLHGFDAEILAYDPYVHDIDTDLTGAELVDFGTVLDSADALIVAAELTSETRGMIDRIGRRSRERHPRSDRRDRRLDRGARSRRDRRRGPRRLRGGAPRVRFPAALLRGSRRHTAHRGLLDPSPFVDYRNDGRAHRRSLRRRNTSRAIPRGAAG